MTAGKSLWGIAGATVLALTIGTANGQDAVPPSKTDAPPGTVCEEMLGKGDFLRSGPDTTVEDTDAGCRFTKVYFYPGDTYSRWAVGELVAEGHDLREALEQDRVPHDLVLTANGAYFSPDIQQPAYEYVLEAQQSPFSVHLAYAWDEAAQTFTLSRAGIEHPGLGRFLVEASFTDVTRLPEHADEDFLRSARFASLSVTLDNQHLFQNMFLPIIIGLLPQDEDPRPQIEVFRKIALNAIAGLPDKTADEATKAALSQLVESFPTPRGLYQVTVTPETPLGIEDIEGETGNPLALLEAVRIEGRHEAPSAP